MASASVTPLAAIAFTAGVLAICAQTDLPSPAILALVAIPASIPWRGRALWAMATFGALLATWQGQRYLDERWPAARHNEEIVAQGRIASLPELSQDEGETRTW